MMSFKFFTCISSFKVMCFPSITFWLPWRHTWRSFALVVSTRQSISPYSFDESFLLSSWLSCPLALGDQVRSIARLCHRYSWADCQGSTASPTWWARSTQQFQSLQLHPSEPSVGNLLPSLVYVRILYTHSSHCLSSGALCLASLHTHHQSRFSWVEYRARMASKFYHQISVVASISRRWATQKQQ